MVNPALSSKEKKFLARQLRYRPAFLVFCWAGLIAAAAVLIHHAITRSLDGETGVLVVLILLQSRANLKQFKDASLLEKFSRAGADGSEEPTGQGSPSA